MLTDVVADDGVVGHSVVFTYTPRRWDRPPSSSAISSRWSQGEPLAPAEIEQKLARRFRLLGTQGLVGMALAAIDMALWDALARAARDLAGATAGRRREAVPAYGAVGYDGAERLGAGRRRAGRRAASRASRPRSATRRSQEDVAVIRAMRQRRRRRRGDHGRLQPVASRRPKPMQRMRVLDDEGLDMGRGADARPRLRRARADRARGATPIQCGENWWGALDLQHAIDAHASDYVMPDVMKIGGVTGWLRAAAIAQARGIRVSNHLWPEISAQLLCVTPTAHWLEYADWWNPILAEPLAVENGMASVDEALGTGVEWNEQAIERFLVRG